MLVKLIEFLMTVLPRKWAFLPLIMWSFVALLSILAFDPLSPIQTEAQKIWSSITSYAPLILKYGTAIVQIAFFSTFVFLFFGLVHWFRFEQLKAELQALVSSAFFVFMYAGSLLVPFLFFPNPNVFWNFASITDDLLKCAAFFYLFALCSVSFDVIRIRLSAAADKSLKNQQPRK